MPLIVLSGIAAGAVANQGPRIGRYIPLAKAERLLPVLLLNVIIPSLTLILLAAMRLSARRARPPAAAAAAAAPAPSSSPSAADLRSRFTDGDIMTIISLLNMPLALSCLRVYLFVCFYPLPAREKPKVRRKFCVFLISTSLLIGLVLGLILGLPRMIRG